MWNNGGYNQYANNPPPPPGGGGGWGAPPPPQGHYDNRAFPGQLANNGFPGASYAPPPGPPQQQWGGGGGGGWGAPPGPPPQQQGGWGAPPPPQQQYAPPPGGPGGFQQYPPPPGGPPMRPPTGQQHYGPQFQGQGGPQQPFFQYSQCTGKRKALLIGINYFNQQGQLRGCINDVQNVKRFLQSKYGYRDEDMVILTDDTRNPRQMPTKQNMIQAMHWLVQGAQPNDSLFFHYSGHGGQTEDLDGDEDDGMDEVIYPVDFKQAGHIVDDEMHAIMVRPLPPGCRLTAIFDSCHSATALDLPYVYSTEGKIKEPNLLAEAGKGVLGAGMSYLKGDIGGMLSGIMGAGKQMMGGNSNATNITKQTRTAPGDVVMWSGCKDSQTSADTQEAGQATGAMSYAFIAALNKNPQQSYLQLLRSIREELAGKYQQKPQLSSSHPMDVNLLFIC
ncbi:Metacaspase-1 [Vanrija pseudolonga]|uniref:Metacaspase-1 n=1 Tax=Vanrija pseudolonga TaxID=143232 RepID=A0AAF1BEX7_9TREE|nr:Metacaspase-1 [Vanrija pseudolonga]